MTHAYSSILHNVPYLVIYYSGFLLSSRLLILFMYFILYSYRHRLLTYGVVLLYVWMLYSYLAVCQNANLMDQKAQVPFF